MVAGVLLNLTIPPIDVIFNTIRRKITIWYVCETTMTMMTTVPILGGGKTGWAPVGVGVTTTTKRRRRTRSERNTKREGDIPYDVRHKVR